MKRATRFAVQPGWLVMLRDMGIAPADLLVHAGLPADLFARDDGWLTPDEYFRLWHGMEAALGPQALPVAVGRAVSVESFDPAMFASLCSPNLQVALVRLAEFKRLIGPMELTVDVRESRTDIRVDCYGYERPLPRSLGASEFTFLTQLARLATRHQVCPLSVELVTLPADPRACEQFLGCRLRRGDANRMSFSAADAARPFLTENAGMWQVFEPALRQRLSRLERGASIRERVRVALLDMLPAGRSALDDVAGRLAMSRRSLQRHLADESVSFQDVLDDTRRDLAHHYLVQSPISTGEISFLLGFRDANSFLRAFKNWTGSTPGAFRKSMGQVLQ